MVELWHFWPDCERLGCYECLWWDICWNLADCGVEVNWS